jgi:hypothetical protein
MKSNRKHYYDEHNGIFVFEDEISINWLLSQVLNKPKLQITKVSNEELQTFLGLLSTSDLRMPNGQHSLFWLREQIKEKMSLAEAKTSETWHNITTRFRYIVERIDQVLIATDNIHEKMDLKVETQKKISRDPNNMQAYFEPITNQSS